MTETRKLNTRPTLEEAAEIVERDYQSMARAIEAASEDAGGADFLNFEPHEVCGAACAIQDAIQDLAGEDRRDLARRIIEMSEALSVSRVYRAWLEGLKDGAGRTARMLMGADLKAMDSNDELSTKETDDLDAALLSSPRYNEVRNAERAAETALRAALKQIPGGDDLLLRYDEARGERERHGMETAFLFGKRHGATRRIG